ncbi:MAG: hypothetical protein UW94_C0011G0072 [Parcubacteria group bacterium GW2011_GWA2_45_14]|nr:MAG: hypothetical protein UW94_C0011G0072 [Parcubacteria group bacterium GW2011_GWA2_45_14]
MVTYLSAFGKLKGSSTLLPAHGKGGAKATILSFLYSVPPSARKKFWPSPPPLKLWRAGIQAGEKKGVGGKEFRHARAEVKRFRRLALSQTSKQNNFQILFKKQKQTSTKECLNWSGCRESNPGYTHPMGTYYLYTTPRLRCLL